GSIRAIWAIQDCIALDADEESAIELKREVIASQERVGWNPRLSDYRFRPRNLKPPVPSLAEFLHVFRIAGEVTGQTLHRTCKIASQVIAGDRASARSAPQGCLQALADQNGLADAPRLRLALEVREKVVRQFQ